MKSYILTIMTAVFLSGCASVFTKPVYEDPYTEQLECYKSVLCRFFINDLPPWTVLYTGSIYQDHKSHALFIADMAASEGRPVKFVYGTVRGGRPYIVAAVGLEPHVYVFDNGSVSTDPIPLKDLDHFMTIKGETKDRNFLMQ